MGPLYRSHRYFTEFTASKAVLYTVATLYVSAVTVLVMIQPFMTVPCHHVPTESDPHPENALYVYNPCRMRRYSKLLGLTVEECEFGRRLVWAVVLGCLIGWERKQADRPAGIRTMSLVSLGSCLFSICSTFAFMSGPMNWDASRISAAIPSGVGFLGSALIFKNKDDENNVHEVHGLTTAASVWLSAAVGIACAGGMYFVASLSTAIMLVLLRFGPRTNIPLEYESEEDEELGDLKSSRNFQIEVDNAIANLNAKNNQQYQSTQEALEKDHLLPSPNMMRSESQRSTGNYSNAKQRNSKKSGSRPSLMGI